MQAAWRVLEGTLKAEPADPATRSTLARRRREMLREQVADRVDAVDGTRSNSPAAKPRLHLHTNGLPLRFADFRRDAAVGDDLDRVIGEQDVDQHAGVVLGVPHVQTRERFVRALRAACVRA